MIVDGMVARGGGATAAAASATVFVLLLAVKAKHVEIGGMVMRVAVTFRRFPFFPFLLVAAAFVLGMVMTERQGGQLLRQRRRR